MTRSTNSWQRVSRQRPCPICERPDWCLYAGDHDHPEAAICARVESAKRCGAAGWLHRLRDDGSIWSPRVRRIQLCAGKIGQQDINFAELAAECSAAVQPQALERLATSLGVSVASLTRLGIGWSGKHRAWTFPMSDTDGNVLGIRLRLANGTKLSVKGTKEGIFIPIDLGDGGRLLIAEGPTDTAALLDLGFAAVGRPSCTGGVKLLLALVHKLAVPEVVIVADGDEPGRRGAENLASIVVAYSALVRIVLPPAGVKDAREWSLRGATGADVQSVIEATPVRRLRICMKGRRP